MHIGIKLFSGLRDHLPREARGEATIDLPAAATIQQMLAQLGIVGADHPVKLVIVNGQRVTDLQHVLSEGDTVHIFPPVVGG